MMNLRMNGVMSMMKFDDVVRAIHEDLIAINKRLDEIDRKLQVLNDLIYFAVEVCNDE